MKFDVGWGEALRRFGVKFLMKKKKPRKKKHLFGFGFGFGQKVVTVKANMTERWRDRETGRRVDR